MADPETGLDPGFELPTYPKRGMIISHGRGARLWAAAFAFVALGVT